MTLVTLSLGVLSSSHTASAFWLSERDLDCMAIYISCPSSEALKRYHSF